MNARDALAAVQQRADRVVELRDRDGREGIRAAYEVASAADVPRLVAALGAVLDLADALWQFEDENPFRAEGKASAAASIRFVIEQHLNDETKEGE